jgi:hypothetical protein
MEDGAGGLPDSGECEVRGGGGGEGEEPSCISTCS